VPVVLGVGIPLLLVGVVLLPLILVVVFGCWLLGSLVT
jgi:hypothetical protein